jgi:hypothetical protein
MDMAGRDAALVEGMSDRGQHARRPAQIALVPGKRAGLGKERIEIRRLVTGGHRLQRQLWIALSERAQLAQKGGVGLGAIEIDQSSSPD